MSERSSGISAVTAEPPTPRRVLATRRALLEAGREVFAANGFERATITDIVLRSGTSTGSLYNRFGGKENLFLELHRRHNQLLWDMTHEAIDEARTADPKGGVLNCYLVGVRVFLIGCWQERDLARLFLVGDGPPGFDALALDGRRRWIDENADLLGIAGLPLGRELAAAVTGVVASAAQRIVECAERADAELIADYFVELVGRVAAPTVT